MTKSSFAKISMMLLILAVSLGVSSTVQAAVTITIQNIDTPGVGFNDPTPAIPVGNNEGTTIGAQRLNAFQFAANIWGATLNSNTNIVVKANWDALSCTQNSAVLGSAGTATIHSNFPNAPFQDTWYSVALANALAGSDRNGATAEINATFNVNIGSANCFAGSPWYYGLDNNHGDGVDLVSVLLHELAHGLGFQTFTNSATGAQATNGQNTGLPSIYDRFLRDNTSGKLWSAMTDAERVASAINTGNLVWAGQQVVTDVPNVLGTPRLKINSPAAIAGSYTVGTAEFGGRLSFPGLTADVVRALDMADGGGPTTTDGCSAFTNSVLGKIAFIDRGTCNFTVKVKNAQLAGAIGVIIGNVASSTDPNTPPGMGGADITITIPALSLAVGDANSIRANLGSTVNGSLLLDTAVPAGADSSNRIKMYSPNPREAGSSVSHFDTSAFPNQLMEPNNSDDLNHTVTTPADLTFSLLRDLGWQGGVAPPTPTPTPTPLPTPTPGPSTIQLTGTSFSVGEGGATLNVSVSRSGDTSGAASVQYATSDAAGANLCNVTNGQASSRCDYLTTLGTLSFAAGETSKTISIPIVDDVYAEGTETFSLTLSNVSGSGATLGTPVTATLTITDNDATNGTNPIDTTSFFVRQQYIDFLNREPDDAGRLFWTNEINVCGPDPQCIQVKRINVSAAFFLSIEFQETGYLVYRVYKSAFGNLTTPPGAPVPIGFSDFLRDTQQIGKGVQVGIGNWQAQLEANKQAYMLAFVQRADFQAQYPNSMTAQDFVTQLNIRAGGVLSVGEQATLINQLGATPADVTTRSQVVRAVAEDAELRAAELNKAFVLMQYFGYLRRSPNEAPDTNFNGYNFWLGKLNSFGGNFVNAEMVKAFITSAEYRQRFGP